MTNYTGPRYRLNNPNHPYYRLGGYPNTPPKPWPKPAAAAPAAPDAPAQPTFSPYLDPGYAASSISIGTQDQHAQAEHDYQIHNLGQNYGYDESGNLITSGADLNPYAQAAILKRNYDNTVQGTDNNAAAQGQLYAGSRINAQNANDFNYGQASDALKRAAQASYHSNDLSLQGTQDAGQAQLAAMLGPAFQAFLAQQQGGS